MFENFPGLTVFTTGLEQLVRVEVAAQPTRVNVSFEQRSENM